MDKVRLGIIGVGGMGMGHARNMAQVAEVVDFVAVADVDPEAVRAATEKYDVRGFARASALI